MKDIENAKMLNKIDQFNKYGITVIKKANTADFGRFIGMIAGNLR